MEQFNNLIEFRQAIYEHGFTKAGDAQFELVDALLLGRSIRSFPELSVLSHNLCENMSPKLCENQASRECG